ncbi:MAG: D-alanine--D-alanine ligase family protein [Rickettsiales bacterium]|nr:MAG: D-alanine--D-alanine ligase family protein [Rickettsiales bacterium]
MDSKINVAVFFGGKSFEHDVSIITGIEVCLSLDFTKYNIIPVYLDLNNQLWTGEALMSKTIYPLQEWGKKMLQETKLLIGEPVPTLQVKKQGMFLSGLEKIKFDVAFCAFHGEYGENGPMQGLFEVAGIPYTGCRFLSSALAMNKSFTKMLAKKAGVSVLDEILLTKPNDDFFDIDQITQEVKFNFPVIVKPNALGSSVGVSKANNKEELNTAVMSIFTLGENALVEPFVENLEEYNISVTKVFDNKTTPSIIERPKKKTNEFLDFKEKYVSSGGTKANGAKIGTKFGGSNSSGMLSMTRDYNPKELSTEEKAKLQDWAVKVFDVLECNGVVRIDFLCNSKTKEFYLCEINTIPGSLSYYLWEASEPAYSKIELVEKLVDEAIQLNKKVKGNIILNESKIFKEKLEQK